MEKNIIEFLKHVIIVIVIAVVIKLTMHVLTYLDHQI